MSLEEVRILTTKVNEATQRRNAAIERALGPGKRITFRKAGHLLSGVVIWAGRQGRICVMTAGGKQHKLEVSGYIDSIQYV